MGGVMSRTTYAAWLSGAAVAFLAVAFLSGCATFQEGAALPPPDGALAACEGSVGARLQYLEPRLAAHASYADRWWWLWNGVHATGLVYGGVMAGVEDDGGERALAAVDATKSAIGLADGVLDPPVLRKGIDPITDIETATAEGCVARLRAAEELLYAAADDAHAERRGWIAHAGNLALNLIGAVVVAEGFDEPSGWGAGALGFVVGEVELWSFPWHAEHTVREYERRFPRDELSTPRWRIEEKDGETVMVLD
jgi:hypothetical protein